MKNKTPPRPRDASVSAADFRLRKLNLALAIMGIGMLIALAWAAVQGWGLRHGYPYNTFLFSPQARFNDFSDLLIDAVRANPYVDPDAIYLPFAWVFLRAFAALPYFFCLTLFLFVGISGFYLLLMAALADIVHPPWKRVVVSLVFLAFSYPVVFTIDRGNLELYVAGLVAAAIYFFRRSWYGLGTLCLTLGASFKLYPFLFLLLLLRQRRGEWIAAGALGFILVIFLSFGVLGLPLASGFEFYGRDLVFLTRAYVLENCALEGCASLWNVYKVALITAAHGGLIAPVDFTYDGSFIVHSYTAYSVIMVLIGAGLALYVCFVEREYLRCAIVLLLFLSVATPIGSDYRLLHAATALVALVVIRTRRPWDLTALVLLALVMVPKKEIFLTYAGRTESNFTDVSIQVVLDPLLVFAALSFLVYDGYRMFNPRWARLRWRGMVRATVGRSWTKSLLGGGRPRANRL